MTGPEAYKESLRLARVAADYEGQPTTAHVQTGQLSQTYALLALAAATALNQAEPGMTREDWEAWLGAGVSAWERPSARKGATS